MLDIHIDDFCKDSALSLKILYDAFPCNSDLLVDQIIGPDELDDFGLHSRRHQACLATMLWLADEGLIRVWRADSTGWCRPSSIDQRCILLIKLTQPS